MVWDIRVLGCTVVTDGDLVLESTWAASVSNINAASISQIPPPIFCLLRLNSGSGAGVCHSVPRTCEVDLVIINK